MFVQTEITPNPNSIKFLPGKPVSNSGSFEITKKDNINNELIRNLLSVNGVEGIFLGKDFISINKYDDLANKYYTRYSKTNPLHSDMYPQIRNMEVDIINVCKSLYKCPGVGSLTSGGTESLLLTCLAYRDHDLENKNITHPNIVGFETIHPAFDKACHYFNIKLRRCKDLREIRRNIDSNTICIVGSAPDYPFGLIDPIEELNELAIAYKVNFHIDACMGGFLIPFIDDYSWINFQKLLMMPHELIYYFLL